MADFNDTNITLVFEPDEEVAIYEKSTPIFVTDDAINEATEQVFIAELILVTSVDPTRVSLTTRPSSLCTIVDYHDRKYCDTIVNNNLWNIDTTIIAIRLGFELPSYTYTEPYFEIFIDGSTYVSLTGRPENGPIFLVKEGDVISEQTFCITFQATDSAPVGIQPATINQDYDFGAYGRGSATYTISPYQQRISFSFELRGDTLHEGNEAFQASVRIS